jgi:hypothetical protein
MMQKVRIVTTITVLVHAAVIVLHAVAHGILEVNGSWFDNAFIVLVIIVSPLVAGALIWTKHRRIGVVILGLSMLGAFVYGAYNHFVALGIDNVSEVSAHGWGAIFHLTAILLAAIEGLGCAVAIWAFNILGRERVEM